MLVPLTSVRQDDRETEISMYEVSNARRRSPKHLCHEFATCIWPFAKLQRANMTAELYGQSILHETILRYDTRFPHFPQNVRDYNRNYTLLRWNKSYRIRRWSFRNFSTKWNNRLEKIFTLHRRIYLIRFLPPWRFEDLFYFNNQRYPSIFLCENFFFQKVKRNRA